MVSPDKQNQQDSSNKKHGFVSKKSSKPVAARGKSKAVKPKKLPYADKNIYLDLKGRKESQKLENCLKALGATVAVFLDKAVTHVVSDRVENWCVSAASPAASISPLPSPLPSPCPSPSTSDISNRPRSRGSAMLERVSNWSFAGHADPVHLANQWGIPVLSVTALWRDVSRFHEKLSRKPAPHQPKVQSEFIKVESLSGEKKPDLLKLHQWPLFDVDCLPGLTPFLWAKAGDGLTHSGTKMTRRPLKNSVSREEEPTGGGIVNKSSVLCNGHANSRHSSQEDLKVQCNGLSSSHRSSKLLSPSGSDVLPLGSSRRSTRRASASWCGSTRELSRELSQLSPLSPNSPTSNADSELGITLRPKGTLWLPVALIGTTAEEHGNSVRRRGSLTPDTAHLDPRPPQKRKKLSPEEKLLQDNKEYFKMEVLNTKLRSSGSLVGLSKDVPQISKLILKKVKGQSRPKWTKTKDLECNEDSVDYEALIVENKIMKMNGVAKKTKRPRRSELMKLCDEAESFMFGESSRQSAASEDDRREESSLDSASWDDSKLRRKRRSHAEAFIHDNLDYYKFETPGSRLRSHSSCCESDTEEPLECRAVVYSFQTVPLEEPWYETYCRQDAGREEHFPVMSDPAHQPFLLPYELPRPVYTRPEPGDYYAKRRKRIAQILAQNHPRKSPRCHASTLAILSSLKKRKRKSSTTEHEASPRKTDELLGVASDEEVEDLPLLDPVDPASEPNRRRKKTECSLALASLSEDVAIGPAPVDVVELVERFRYDKDVNVDANWLPEDGTAKIPRKRRKWRKINRTGWEKVKVKVKKGKAAPHNSGITTENIIVSPRRSRASSTPDAGVQVSPCVVRVRKLSLRNGDTREGFCRKLVLKRKRSITDYSWTTNTRRR